MYVWECGVGVMFVCGIGVCAIVVVGVFEGRVDRRCIVEFLGGLFEIEWCESDGRIIMIGFVEFVFVGKYFL